MNYPVILDEIVRACEAEYGNSIGEATRELLRVHLEAVAGAYKAGFERGVVKGGEVA